MLAQLKLQRGSFNLDVDIAVHAGVIALFGRSGCGKTTLVNVLAGLLRPDHGVIKLDDMVLLDTARGIDVPAEQRGIGYVFQDARLFPHYSVAGNLRYGAQRTRAAVTNHFDVIVELLGLGSLLSRRPQQLSGGERQRVALGRALLAQPRLLLLDEPLASLDLARRAEVMPYLEQIRDQFNIPMVYVSHQFEEVLQLADHVVLMQDGHIAVQGDLPAISLHPALQQVVGMEAFGAVIEGRVTDMQPEHGLAQISIGASPHSSQLSVEARSLQLGQRVRLQLLARDLILAVNPTQGISVRNQLQGRITQMRDDHVAGYPAVLVSVDVGGVELLARITRLAASELQLRVALPVWVLVKVVTLRGHVYGAI